MMIENLKFLSWVLENVKEFVSVNMGELADNAGRGWPSVSYIAADRNPPIHSLNIPLESVMNRTISTENHES